ncbi:hypothetical protein EE612_056405, partial [Oryza sativa]
GGVESRAA